MPLTNAEKKRRQAEKKIRQGLKEIRGAFVKVENHDRVKAEILKKYCRDKPQDKQG